MSDSVRPHKWQPTRLLHPWDFPGKNTGVGCNCLLHCMKVKSESEVTQSCPTLSDPKDCSLPGSSTHEIFQARVLEWIAIAFFKLIDYWLGNWLFCFQLYHLTHQKNRVWRFKTMREKKKKDICTLTFIVALFIIANIQKHPKWPLTDEWIKRMWYIDIKFEIDM